MLVGVLAGPSIMFAKLPDDKAIGAGDTGLLADRRSGTCMSPADNQRPVQSRRAVRVIRGCRRPCCTGAAASRADVRSAALRRGDDRAGDAGGDHRGGAAPSRRYCRARRCCLRRIHTRTAARHASLWSAPTVGRRAQRARDRLRGDRYADHTADDHLSGGTSRHHRRHRRGTSNGACGPASARTQPAANRIRGSSTACRSAVTTTAACRAEERQAVWCRSLALVDAVAWTTVGSCVSAASERLRVVRSRRGQVPSAPAPSFGSPWAAE